MAIEVWMTDDRGVKLSAGPLDHTLGFAATRIANGVGRLDMRLKVPFNRDLIIPDKTQVQIWRTPPGGSNALFRTYNIDGFRYANQGGRQTIQIRGADMNDILRRRIVAYFSQSDHHGVKTVDEADDIMKALIDENFIDAVLYDDFATPDTDRIVSDYLSVAGDLSDGVVIGGEWAWGSILRKLAIIGQMSRQGGIEVFFDIVPDAIGVNSITWKFITKTGQPGADLTSGKNQVVFSQERKNMIAPSYDEDWADSINVAYAGGAGLDSSRVMATAEDSTRSKRGTWARREMLTHAINQGNNETAIQDAADAAIEENQPVREFTAVPVDIEGSTFGVDWNFGDKVIAKYLNYEFQMIIRSVLLSVTPENGEQIQTNLDWRSS